MHPNRPFYNGSVHAYAQRDTAVLRVYADDVFVPSARHASNLTYLTYTYARESPKTTELTWSEQTIRVRRVEYATCREMSSARREPTRNTSRKSIPARTFNRFRRDKSTDIAHRTHTIAYKHTYVTIYIWHVFDNSTSRIFDILPSFRIAPLVIFSHDCIVVIPKSDALCDFDISLIFFNRIVFSVTGVLFN